MNYFEVYKNKIVSVNQAISLIKDNSNIWFDYLQPKLLLQGLKEVLETNSYSNLNFYYYASSSDCEETIFLDKFNQIVKRH